MEKTNPNHLKKEAADKYAAAKAIADKATGEERAMTKEEVTGYDALVAEAKNMEGQAKDLEDTAKRAEQSAETEKRLKEKAVPKVGAQVQDNHEDEEFRSIGDQLVAVIASAGNQNVDPRLRGINTRAITGMGEEIPPDGGFFVQTDFSTQILERVHEVGQVAAKTLKIPVKPGSNGITLPAVNQTSRADGSRWGGIQAYWTGEAGSYTGSKPTFREMNLKFNKVTGLVYITDELVQDAGALGGLVQRIMPEELAFKVEDAIINGDGAGKPKGILPSACTVEVSAETEQVAATIVYENLITMWGRLDARSKANSVWLVNQDVEPQFYTMTLDVGTGGSAVYLPPGGASAAPFSTLLGRPVMPIEYCATLGTVGDIILADLSQYVMIERSVASASSIHVNFTTGEQVLRFTYRVDGQPIWATALTPKNGTNDVSPFVSLATRA